MQSLSRNPQKQDQCLYQGGICLPPREHMGEDGPLSTSMEVLYPRKQTWRSFHPEVPNSKTVRKTFLFTTPGLQYSVAQSVSS